MKKEIFAICDPELSYVQKLMEVIQKRQGSVFEVQAFTNVNSLCEFASEHPIALLLISGQVICESVQKLPIERIMILSEGERLEQLESYPCIYKYQASDLLIAEIMGSYAAEKKTAPYSIMKKHKKMIGVYSPVRRAGKTSFALTLGQILAKNQSVLYLNMENYSGFAELLDKEFAADLSDLMYFVKRGYGSLVHKLQGMVQSIQKLDYVPPALSPFDLRSVTCEEWMTLLREIESYSTYEIVILDLDETIDGFLNLLSLCDVIYMPVDEDVISIAKIHQYEKLIQLGGYEALLEKTKKLKLSLHHSVTVREHYIEQLVWGDFGEYVRQIIREEEGNGTTAK